MYYIWIKECVYKWKFLVELCKICSLAPVYRSSPARAAAAGCFLLSSESTEKLRPFLGLESPSGAVIGESSLNAAANEDGRLSQRRMAPQIAVRAYFVIEAACCAARSASRRRHTKLHRAGRSEWRWRSEIIITRTTPRNNTIDAVAFFSSRRALKVPLFLPPAANSPHSLNVRLT